VVKIGQWRNPYEPYNDVTQQVFGGPLHKGELYSFHAPSSLPLVIWLLPFAWITGYVGTFLAWGIVSLLALWEQHYQERGCFANCYNPTVLKASLGLIYCGPTGGRLAAPHSKAE